MHILYCVLFHWTSLWNKTSYDVQDIVNGFNSKWGFPQCVGARDGTHTPITDLNRMFLTTTSEKAIIQSCVHVYVARPRGVMLRVFLRIRSCNCSGMLLSHIKNLIHGIDVPLLILGGPAYPFYHS